MIKTTEIAWLGGLLEGEGYFLLNRERYPQIGLGMTDEDVVVKAAALMKTRVCRNGNMYRTQVNGARAIKWMMILLPFLCKRRRERIASIIKVWKNVVYLRAPPGMRIMASCHSDRVVVGFGLCNSCYARQYRKKTTT